MIYTYKLKVDRPIEIDVVANNETDALIKLDEELSTDLLYDYLTLERIDDAEERLKQEGIKEYYDDLNWRIKRDENAQE